MLVGAFHDYHVALTHGSMEVIAAACVPAAWSGSVPM